MKLVTSEQLNRDYPVGTIFAPYVPADAPGSCYYPSRVGDVEVIVERADFGICRTRELFDMPSSDVAGDDGPMDTMKVGDELRLDPNGSTSCAGCYGEYCPGEFYVVFDLQDMITALTGTIVLPEGLKLQAS